jgi:hypothetical protein
MAKKGKNIERFLRRRFLGEHKVEKFYYQPWSFVIKDINVQSRKITVTYIHHNHAPETVIRGKVETMLRYIGDYKLGFTQITPFELAIHKLRTRLRGSHRYRDHDYNIVTVGTRLKEDMHRAYHGTAINPDRFDIYVAFKMRDWRGDREFIHTHITQQVREEIIKLLPDFENFYRVRVHMIKK